MLDFKTKEYGEDKEHGLDNSYTSITAGNTGAIIYDAEETLSRGMASIEVTLPEDYSVDTDFLQKTFVRNVWIKCWNLWRSVSGNGKIKNRSHFVW